MSDTSRLAQLIAKSLPNLKSGAIRMWGIGFGAPGDNQHAIVSCKAVNDRLLVGFDKGETLSVWSSRNWEISAEVFKIEKVEHVRWEWHYYGRAAKQGNLYYIDLISGGRTIAASSNVDWCQPDLRADIRLPAAEIV